MSWPFTSGSTLTSVARTTPTIVAADHERRAEVISTPGTSTSAIATMAVRLALCMSPSSLHGKRRDHGEREIGQRQTPQSEPIMRDLPDAGAQLVDTHEAIYRDVGGENPTQRDGRVGDCFARPCEAGGGKMRQAGCKKEEGGVLRPGGPGPAAPAPKAM